jgi:GDPmannose 4,6-dehydratase
MTAQTKTALIFGVSGQDGAYLAQLLLANGYTVHGTSRDREMASFANLKQLGICDAVALHSVAVTDFRSVLQVLSDVRPDRIFNLAAQSSVGLSFGQPIETIESIMIGTMNILEAIRFLRHDTKLFHAASSECFGNTSAGPATESTPFRPRSPYAVGKAAAFWAVANYREAYGLFACSGLLFNHESPLRPGRFVTQKIVRAAADIAEKRYDKVRLGNLDISRDWGWSPEYVGAMVRMLDLDAPEDLVIATGEMHAIREFAQAAFAYFGLDWHAHVESDPTLFRPSDITVSVGCSARAEKAIGWRPAVRFTQVVEKLIEAELAHRSASPPS